MLKLATTFDNGVLITLRCDFRPIENPGYAEQQPATSAACSSKGVIRVCCSYVARRSGRAAAAAAELSLPVMTLTLVWNLIDPVAGIAHAALSCSSKWNFWIFSSSDTDMADNVFRGRGTPC